MGRVRGFNRQEYLTSDFDFLQDTKDTQTRNVLVDRIEQPGILIPMGASAQFIENGVQNTSGFTDVFPITASATTGMVHVGPNSPIADPSIHIAYNEDGNRIAFPVGDQVTFDEDAPDAYTVNMVNSTPYSTGRINVDGRAGEGDGDRYVFISYLEVVRTKGYPPNHGTITPGVPPTITATDDYNKPIVGIDQLTGEATAVHLFDGYRIYVAISTEVTFESDGTPILNGGIYTDSAKAIYLGRFQISGGSVANIILHDATRPRNLLQLRSADVGTVGDTGTAASLPTTYAANQTVTLQQHVSAVGTGTPSPIDPHGYDIEADLEGVPTSRLINTDAPLTGGGDLSDDLDLDVTTIPSDATAVVGTNAQLLAGDGILVDGSTSADLDHNVTISATSPYAITQSIDLTSTEITSTSWQVIGGTQLTIPSSAGFDTARQSLILFHTSSRTVLHWNWPIGMQNINDIQLQFLLQQNSGSGWVDIGKDAIHRHFSNANDGTFWGSSYYGSIVRSSLICTAQVSVIAGDQIRAVGRISYMDSSTVISPGYWMCAAYINYIRVL